MLELELKAEHEALNRALSDLLRASSDWRPAWEGIEHIFYAAEKRLFESEGASGGERWKPLSAAYARWKRLRFPGRPILVRTGSLKRSLIGRSSSFAIHEATEDSLTLGTSHPAARYHQRTRPAIQLTPSDVMRMKRRMLQRMMTVGAQSGFKTVGEAGI